MRRFERIMYDIERGLTDEQLARRYPERGGMPGENRQAAALGCMRCYRKAHDGGLSEGTFQL